MVNFQNTVVKHQFYIVVNGKLTHCNSFGNGSPKMFRDTSRPYHAFMGIFFHLHCSRSFGGSFYICHRFATILKLKILKPNPLQKLFGMLLVVVPIKVGWQFVFFDFRSPIFNDCYSKIFSCYHCTGKPVLRDHCHERPAVLMDHMFLTEGPTFPCN